MNRAMVTESAYTQTAQTLTSSSFSSKETWPSSSSLLSVWEVRLAFFVPPDDLEGFRLLEDDFLRSEKNDSRFMTTTEATTVYTSWH